ncbi:hypothetical protein KY284_026933 [Solanum tuberosum]|nr:hypothetical protein KY284_026933 [Solanum tuberosum]
MVVYLGYATTQKGYLLYDLTSHVLFVHKDVIFKEDKFPFKTQDQQHIPLFRSTGLNDGQPTSVTNSLHQLPIADQSQFQGTCSSEEISAETNNPALNRYQVHVHGPLVIQEENRRSAKGKKPPLWMKDFVSLHAQHTSYSLDKYMSYDQAWYLFIYVDDMLIIGSSLLLVEETND